MEQNHVHIYDYPQPFSMSSSPKSPKLPHESVSWHHCVWYMSNTTSIIILGWTKRSQNKWWKKREEKIEVRRRRKNRTGRWWNIYANTIELAGHRGRLDFHRKLRDGHHAMIHARKLSSCNVVKLAITTSFLDLLKDLFVNDVSIVMV